VSGRALTKRRTVRDYLVVRMTRRRAAGYVLGLAALLAIARAASVPAWFADAQYYVQAGRLFHQGNVTFAGHLVGDRHVAIGYYQIFQSVFGSSADSVAIALAFTFAIAAGLVIGLCFQVGAGVWLPALTAAGLVLVLAVIPIWNSMLTDPLLLVLVLFVLNGVAWWPRVRSRWWMIAVLGAICGLGYGVRPETLVLLIAVMLAGAVAYWQGIRSWAREGVTVLAAFAVGYAVQSAAWHVWIPAPKPPTYSAAFLFYLPMYYHAEPGDGPATAALARLEESAGLPLTSDFIGLFPVMAAGAKAHAVKETDRLIARAGLELLTAKAGRLLAMFGREGVQYLRRPGLTVERSTDPWDARWRFMRDRLRDLDQRREQTSAGFGNDAWWRTETLADRHVSMVVWLRSWLPSWSMLLRLPGVLLVCGLAATAVSIAFARQHCAPCLTACLFVIGAFIITNFSQGFDPRYSETWRYLSLVMIALTVLAWPQRALTNP
jgi:hypothetical protein